jgi:E1A-binding protein p400
MSKMLDLLEVFVNAIGVTYLRMDGQTPVDRRFLLIERFNTDPRVFVFLLSPPAAGASGST